MLCDKNGTGANLILKKHHHSQNQDHDPSYHQLKLAYFSMWTLVVWLGPQYT